MTGHHRGASKKAGRGVCAMIIREARERDVPPLAAFARRTFKDAFAASMAPGDLKAHLDQHLSPQRLGEMIREDLFFLAEIRDRLVGFLQLGAARIADAPARGAMEIRRLYVLGHFQNEGIGSKLMRTTLDHLASHGDPDIYLDVWAENEGAQRFYRRFGFETVGERPFHVASGAQTGVDLVMRRRSSVREMGLTPLSEHV